MEESTKKEGGGLIFEGQIIDIFLSSVRSEDGSSDLLHDGANRSFQAHVDKATGERTILQMCLNND